MKIRTRVIAILSVAVLIAVVSVAQEKGKENPNPAPPKSAETRAGQQPSEQAQGANPAPKHGAEGKAEKAESQEGPSAELAEASREAAGEEEENAEFKLSPSVRWVATHTGLSPHGAYWLLYSLDFLIIALAIGWVWKSNIPAAFRARTQSIRKTMDEAQKASADATRRLTEIEVQLAKLDSEIAAMRVSAEADAAAEEQRIHASAEEDARKIIASADAEIQSAARLAQRDLKAYAAELAVSLAEKRIQVDAATDEALVQNFVGQLGQSNGAKENR
ncbi:MAG: hypothetical protein ACR2IF_00810 [Terriglobales bacterium]